VALDVGSNLLERARTRCSGPLIVGDVGALPFASATFDVVISSEVIEHTQNPYRTIEEMSRVLKPNGCLLLTVPNRIWKFAVIVANKLKLRPWNGLENWVGWSELKRWMNETGLDVELMLGFHIIPLPMQVTYRFLDWCDRWGDYLGPVMLNIGVRARKKIVK
jgi:ubiquinone/menaquinone biosynthesis C-methylase UbiE